MSKRFPALLTDPERDELPTPIGSGVASSRILLHPRMLPGADHRPPGARCP